MYSSASGWIEHLPPANPAPVLYKAIVMETLLSAALVVTGITVVQVLVLQPLSVRKRRRDKLENILYAADKVSDFGPEPTDGTPTKVIVLETLASMSSGRSLKRDELRTCVQSCFGMFGSWASMLNKNRQPEEARKVESLMVAILDVI